MKVQLPLTARQRHRHRAIRHVNTGRSRLAPIVGYATDTLTGGKFYIKAAQFQDVQSGEVDINKVLTGLTSVAYDDNFDFWTTAPQIQVQKATGGYDLYYYLTDGYVDDETYQEGWCDSMGTIVELKLASGTAFWFKNPSDSVGLTVSGEVESLDSVDVVVPQSKFTLVANAYPMSVTLNGTGMTSSDIVSVPYDDNFDFWTTAPQIQVQKATGGYDLYYYLTDGYVDDETYQEGWCDSMGTIVSEATIPVGAGFWMKGTSGEVTLNFAK